MKALIASTLEGIVLLNSKREVELINSSAKSILSIREDCNCYQGGICDFMEEEEVKIKMENMLKKVEAELLEENRVKRTLKLDFASRYYQISFEKISEAGRPEQWILMVIRDVTSEKEYDEMKEQFITNISHELRTPLTAIYGSIENMLKGIVGKFNEKQKEYLIIAQRNSLRLLKLVNELLDLSKLEAGKAVLTLKTVDLARIVEEVLLMFEAHLAENEIEISKDFCGDKIKIIADQERLSRVFINLITNSMKFTRPGGKIDIRIKRNDDNMLLVEVEDNGQGIRKEALEKIFSRFFQVDRSAGPGAHGTGLGLSIVKEIIQLHGGRVWAESELGKGTKISFTLPDKVK
jgi:signal transduction histidine kinase